MTTLDVGRMMRSFDTELQIQIVSVAPQVIGKLYIVSGEWENKRGFSIGAHHNIHTCADSSFEIRIARDKIKLEFVPAPPPITKMKKPKKTNPFVRSLAA